MSVLTNKDLQNNKHIRITPPPPKENQQPASTDLTLDTTLIIANNQKYELATNTNQPQTYPLMPGESLLASTKETISISDHYAAMILGKSSIGRQFIQIHCTAGWIDPGFTGKITLQITNLSDKPFTLKPGMKICQIIFHTLQSQPLASYGHPQLQSHYQNQTTTTPAKN